MPLAPEAEDYYCPECGREWVAVFPEGREVEKIECTGCGQMTGVPK